MKDFIKEIPFNLGIEKLKEFSNRFRNVNNFSYEDNDDKTAYFIADEIDSRIKKLDSKNNSTKI